MTLSSSFPVSVLGPPNGKWWWVHSWAWYPLNPAPALSSRNIVLWASHWLVVLGSGPGHLPPWLGSSYPRDLSGSPSDSGAKSMLVIIRGRCSGGVGSPPWPVLDLWDPLAERGQPSGGGGQVRATASGRALSQTQPGSPQPSLRPVPPLSACCLTWRTRQYFQA